MLFAARKIIAIGLLMLLLMQAGGLSWMRAVTHFQIKQGIRKAIQSGKEVTAVQSFVFPVTGHQIIAPDFSWEEEGEEFLYKGTWYDVLSIDEQAGSIVIQALQDGDDTQLAAAWEQLHTKKSSSSPLHNGTLAKFFSLFESVAPTTLHFFPERTRLFATYYQVVIPSFFSAAIERPPCAVPVIFTRG